MFTKRKPILMAALAGLVILAGCKPARMAYAAPVSTGSPQQAVQDFYTAYYERIGTPHSEDFHNPMVERTYRDIPQLSQALVQEMDTFVENPEGIPYDPFLCAQDIPMEINAGEAQITGGRAVVPVTSDFIGHQFEVELEQLDGAWQITAFRCR